MTALIVVFIQSLCVVGYGAIVLRLLGMSVESSAGLRIGLCFGIGVGVLGWMMLPLSVLFGLGDVALGILLCVGVAGLIAAYPFKLSRTPDRVMPLEIILIGILIILFGLDVLEALAPPSDADSLAYHFALPKLFLEIGKVVFIPRAVDGATPMLVQMTHIPALGFGGEKGLTLWTLVSGWGAVFLMYELCRQQMPRHWSLVAAILFASTPAIIYGAGSGQVETRIALFVMVAAWSVARFFETERFSYVLLAAIAAGFFGGAKLTGLMFMAGVVLIMLPRASWFKVGAVFSVVSALVAAPWYAWTFLHTGDPLFPLFFPVLGVSDPLLWDMTHHEVFESAFRSSETPVSVNPFSLIIFPFIATLFPYPSMEAGRTGLGAAIVLLLPAAIAIAWAGIQSRKINAVGIYGLIAVIFFAIWFLTGTPQRVRHLVPVLPLILIGSVYAAVWISNQWRIAGLVAAALATVVIMQVAGAALFGKQFAGVAAGQEPRDAFLHRTVSLYDPVPWINQNLGPDEKIMTPIRQHLYLLNVPYFFAHAYTQAEVDISPEFGSEDLVPSLHRLGITHVLSYLEPIDGKWLHGPKYRELIDADCLLPVHSGDSTVIRSRTLGGTGETQPYTIFKFDTASCPKP